MILYIYISKTQNLKFSPIHAVTMTLFSAVKYEKNIFQIMFITAMIVT